MNEKEIIYILSNELMPGIFKIGQTSDLIKRINTLNTGVYIPFKLVIAVEVENMKESEKALHVLFGKTRVGAREFFKIEPEKIIPYFRSLGKDITNSFIKPQQMIFKTAKIDGNFVTENKIIVDRRRNRINGAIFLKKVDGKYIVDGESIIDNRYFSPQINKDDYEKTIKFDQIMDAMNLTSREDAILAKYMFNSDIQKIARKLKMPQKMILKCLKRIEAKMEKVSHLLI